MPLGNAISGSGGDVKIAGTQIAEIKKFSLTLKAELHAYASNKTAGWKERVGGTKDWSVSLEGVWDPADKAIAVLLPGTEVDLSMLTDANDTFLGPAIVENWKIEVDIDGGGLVTWTAEAQGNGELIVP
jgi:predicted secreted protein